MAGARVACQLLHSPRTRLGTAGPHGVSSPVGVCMDRQRHATGTAQPQTPPGRRHQDGPDPPAACPPPPLAPAGFRVRRRWAAVPGCPRQPTQRKPLRPDLAPGPRRSHPGERDRRPAVRAPMTFAMPRCRCGWPPAPRPPRSLPAPGTACVSCSPSTPTAYPAATRSPASTSSKPSAPDSGPRWPTTTGETPGIPSVMRPCHSWTQRDTTGPETSAQIRLHVLTCGNAEPRRLAPTDRGPGRAVPGTPVPISR